MPARIDVGSIDFNGFRLRGPTLEGFLDMLPDVALFHGNSNEFRGTVPSGVAKLPYLYELDLSNNRPTGPFPTVVLGMPGLTFLDLRFNQFTESVPGQIFVQNTNAVFLNDNVFDQLPLDNLGGTSHIFYLMLADNMFTGPITPGILNPSLPSTRYSSTTTTSHCLPYELGLLREAMVIDIGDKRLTGTLPLSCLSKVEQLNLAGNQLHGGVPEALCRLGLGNLANLSLSGNYFNNVGPWCRTMIERGVLDIRNNCIQELPSQRPVEECSRFFGHLGGVSKDVVLLLQTL